MRRSVVILACLAAVAGCASHSSAQPAATQRARGLAAPVSIQVILPSRTMTAGSQLAGRVVVNNNTGHAIRRAGCGTLFTVALASSSYHPVVAVLTCLHFFTIPVGTSSYRVDVLASYLACSMGHASGGLRACLPGNKAPPLPPGRYHAKLFFDVRQFAPAPPAIPVRVMHRYLHS